MIAEQLNKIVETATPKMYGVMNVMLQELSMQVLRNWNTFDVIRNFSEEFANGKE